MGVMVQNKRHVFLVHLVTYIRRSSYNLNTTTVYLLLKLTTCYCGIFLWFWRRLKCSDVGLHVVILFGIEISQLGG